MKCCIGNLEECNFMPTCEWCVLSGNREALEKEEGE